MAKQKLVENNEVTFDNDIISDIDTTEPQRVEVPFEKKETPYNAEVKPSTKPLINCLRNEIVIVRHINKQRGMRIDNPKHVAYGGMLENAKKTYCVPMLESGVLVNVLTDAEKDYLENILGLEPNALSIYRKPASNNFWSTANHNGISTVTLTKEDNILDLSNPTDYIKYKILLANKDFIAASMLEYEDCPKATYDFVIMGQNDEAKSGLKNMSTTMKCYMEFGKIQEDKNKLVSILEILEGKPIADSTKLDFLQSKCNEFIQADNKMFLKVITDPLLDTKVLLRLAIANGIISNRGNYYYLRESNMPLCEDGLEPTLNTAAKYLSSPKRLDLKFSIEAKLNN